MPTTNAAGTPGRDQQETGTVADRKLNEQEQGDNPQRGSDWNNYQTRETSGPASDVDAKEAAEEFEGDES